MKTPGFWNNKNFISSLLMPLGKLYAAGTALRFRLKKAQKATCPVICIGNLTAGGTGKTPTAVSIAAILQQCGYHPFFVSRGYGGNLSNVIVNREQHAAHEVGDEPLLLARQAPVSINPNRYQAALKAINEGADAIVMDDGFQNPGLYKNLSFIVFDGNIGIGNGRPVPAGPLREEWQHGIKRANAAIIIGEDKHNLSEKLQNLPLFSAKIESELPPLSTDKLIAFAGIGHPQKFYNSLIAKGITPIETFDFPDHHFYTQQELQDLIDRAWKIDAELITTAKDFVKIPTELQHHFKVLEIKLVWNNEKELTKFILSNL